MHAFEATEVSDQPELHAPESSELLHHGWVWNVVSEKFSFGGGELTREFIAHTGAAAVLALDERDRVLLIQQYRHPARYRDWELPAGLLDDPSESPLEAAKRELAEEADLVADEWHLLLDFWTSPGGSNESIRIFVARGLSATPEPFDRKAEEADMRAAWISIDDAIDCILAGKMQNPAALQAIFAAAESRRRGWSTLRDPNSPWPGRPKPQSRLPKALERGQRA